VPTQCTPDRIEFHDLNSRTVTADFEGGDISSDGGVTLLAEVDRIYRVLERFTACFTDHRDPDSTEHTALDLLRQRVYGLACGYEDLNDHDRLRFDPLLAAAVGKDDPSGQQRRRESDRGAALAGKSTLNRLELTKVGDNADSEYHKIVADLSAIETLLIDIFLDAHDSPPEAITLDIDPTDSPLHGQQWGRHFQAHYDEYCFLPQYVFCGDFLLAAQLRPGDVGPTSGAIPVLARIVARIRERWPEVRITLRADGGFCEEPLLAWCEGQQVTYVIGMPGNSRLLELVCDEQRRMAAECVSSGEAVRTYQELEYRTLDSWSRTRRVVAKVEHLPGEVGETTSQREAEEAERLAQKLEQEAVQAQQQANELFQYSAEESARADRLEAAATAAQRAAGRGRHPAAQAARAEAKAIADQAREARSQSRHGSRAAKQAARVSEKTRVKAERARERADWAAEQSTWAGKSNVRFVVTSSRAEELDARSTYEDVYCLRGDAENRIKEQQLYLFADSLPCERMRANQIRLFLSSFAYVLDMLLRRDGLAGTALERAQCHTIRERLFKIGALIQVTVRRVWVRLSSSYPYQELFAKVASNLRRRAESLSNRRKGLCMNWP
jgi:hypothetical protein